MFKVLIIGAGAIAQGFDSPESDRILTHIKGFSRHPSCEVVGICDAQLERAQEAAKRWGIANAASTPEELAHVKPDIISICTPDDTHEDYLRRALALKPSAVFCEKPLGYDVENVRDLVQEYKEAGVQLAVNYSRRWLPDIQALQRAISAEWFGNIVSARVKYYKGFLHNCSHLLDVLTMLVQPEVVSTRIIKEIHDYTDDDPTISAACTMESSMGSFTLMIEGYDSRQMSPLELELVFERAKILLEECNGTQLTIARLQENSEYAGFWEFSDVEMRRIDGSHTMRNAVDAIVNALRGWADLVSTGESALDTLECCLDIKALPKIGISA